MDKHMNKKQCQNAYRCKYLDEKQVCAYFGISRSTVRNWVETQELPAPHQLGPRCVRWLLSEIEAWEAEQVV